MQGYELSWGEIHTHTDLSDGNGSPEDNFDIARSHLDFWAMADHAYDETVFSLDYRKLAAGRRILNERWRDVQQLCRDREEPGVFIPLLAYEWTNFRYGHHNVYYLDYDQPIRMPPTLPDLYASLRGVEAIVIPHHGGYPVGVCGKDWRVHDDRLSPFVEIYSMHGSSETPAGVRPLLTPGSWMGPGASGGSVQEGLAHGYKLGIMASSDSHEDHPGAYDNGLVAAYVQDLTRPSLWESFRARRLYGVTGDRIALDFSLNGSGMGSSVRCGGDRAIHVAVVGWDRIDRVDLVKNNSLLHSFVDPAGRDDPRGRALRLRFIVEWGWDRMGQRDWQADLTVSAGRILAARPCFRGSVATRLGRGITRLGRRECRWTSTTEKPASHLHSRRSADAMAFEVECERQARLDFRFACGGLERRLSTGPDRILGESTVAYMQDVPATDDGSHWRQMDSYAKIKLHQGCLTEHLSLDLDYEDKPTAPTPGPADFYYVRVLQRNGQRAWSSPIWVT